MKRSGVSRKRRESPPRPRLSACGGGSRRLAEEEAQRLAEEEAADDPVSPPRGICDHPPADGRRPDEPVRPAGASDLRDDPAHNGIDLSGDTGDLILAANDGVVLSAGWRTGYGNAIVISHGGGYTTLYAHLHDIDVSTGQPVSGGDDRLARQHRLVDWAAPALRGPTRRHRSRPDRLLPVLTVPSMRSAHATVLESAP